MCMFGSEGRERVGRLRRPQGGAIDPSRRKGAKGRQNPTRPRKMKLVFSETGPSKGAALAVFSWSGVRD